MKINTAVNVEMKILVRLRSVVFNIYFSSYILLFLYFSSLLFFFFFLHVIDRLQRRGLSYTLRKLHLSPQLGIVDLELEFQDNSKRTFSASPMQVEDCKKEGRIS